MLEGARHHGLPVEEKLVAVFFAFISLQLRRCFGFFDCLVHNIDEMMGGSRNPLWKNGNTVLVLGNAPQGGRLVLDEEVGSNPS